MALRLHLLRTARGVERSFAPQTMSISRRWIAASAGDSSNGSSNGSGVGSGVGGGADKLIAKLKQLNVNGASALQNPFDLPKFLMEYLKPMELLPAEFVKTLLGMAIEYNSSLPNVVTTGRGKDASGNRGVLTVCGDTHGQYHDMCRIFHPTLAGFPSDMNRFIFNGDVTDRGPMALEILLLLLAVQQCNPNAMLLLRGNHECELMNSGYGFEREMRIKYDSSVYNLCLELFSQLPIAAVVEDSVFVVHGGLGEVTYQWTIDQLNSNFSRRVRNAASCEILNELLWADPAAGIRGFKESPRSGCKVYGEDITSSFLARNRLGLIIRSHEMESKGYKLMHNNQSLTVFSAPNYCGQWKNKGAVVRFSPEAVLRGPQVADYEILQFSEEREGPYTFSSARNRLEKLRLKQEEKMGRTPWRM